MIAPEAGRQGLCVPSDPGAKDPHAAEGAISISFAKFFEKRLSIGTSQANVKKYNRYLRDLIVADRAIPSTIVSHEIPLAEAPDAYKKVDKRIDGYTKVILKPAAWPRTAVGDRRDRKPHTGETDMADGVTLTPHEGSHARGGHRGVARPRRLTRA